MPVYVSTPKEPVSPSLPNTCPLYSTAGVNSQRPKGQCGPDLKPAVLRDSRSLEGQARIFDWVPKGPRSPSLWLGGGREVHETMSLFTPSQIDTEVLL